jgi:hypothetical protein
MRFFLSFSTTYLFETAFSAMTALKTTQRNCLQLSVSVWLSVQFIAKITSQRTENSIKNLTSLIKTLKNSAVMKGTTFNFFNKL